jgi:hypothetical protein
MRSAFDAHGAPSHCSGDCGRGEFEPVGSGARGSCGQSHAPGGDCFAAFDKIL